MIFPLMEVIFEESLSNVCKFLRKSIMMNISLSLKKCDFFINAGTSLGHFISKEGIQLNLIKVSIIERYLIPKKGVCQKLPWMRWILQKIVEDFSK